MAANNKTNENLPAAGAKAKKGPKASGRKTSNTVSNIENGKKFGETILDEIILIIIVVISVFMMVSMFSGHMGLMGKLIKALLCGLLGFSGYLLPIFVAGLAVWLLFDSKKANMHMKIFFTATFLIFTAALVQAMGEKEFTGNFLTLTQDFYLNGSADNGGLFGGLLNVFLTKISGNGKYIILLAIIIISIIGVTGRSLFNGVENIIMYFNIRKREQEERIKLKADMIKQREEQRQKKAEKRRAAEERRMSKKRKKNFNFELKENEGLNDDKENPLVEVSEFVNLSKQAEKAEKSEENIYDYKKDSLEEDIEPKINSKDIIEDDMGKESEDKPVDEAVFESIKNRAIEHLEVYYNSDSDQNEDEKPKYNFDEEILEKADEKTDDVNGQNDFTAYIEEDTEDSCNINANSIDTNEAEVPMEEVFEKPASFLENDESSGGFEQTNTEKAENTEKAKEKFEVKEVKKEDAKNSAGSLFEPKHREYRFPPYDILGKRKAVSGGNTKSEMLGNAKKLEETLRSFGVEAKVIQINKGPTVTRYELSPKQGVKVSKIVNLADDIALNLAASGIRIEAPIPGKAAVGIEVPNKETQSVYLRDVLESNEFKNFPSKLAFALGEDIAGNAVVTDIAKMPHLLIAGATGSGKSVCINTLITSILYKANPEEVKLLLVDPKVVELSVYNGIPHLLIPVVTDPKKAAGALNWAVREMLSRYQAFAEHNVRDIKGFNNAKREKNETDLMPQIVIVIDELADLMMASPGEVEDSICRLAQMARAAGLHLIIATQRPSVDVITGVIKANIPSRLAFAVSSGIDSRTVLDMTGAEKLLGKGDMLFNPVGMSKPIRVQGAFITDKEVEALVSYLKNDAAVEYDEEMINKITSSDLKADEKNEDKDEFFEQAVSLILEKEKASISMLQRQFRIGYNRAARLMEDLEKNGIVGPEDGSKPRKILLSSADYFDSGRNVED